MARNVREEIQLSNILKQEIMKVVMGVLGKELQNITHLTPNERWIIDFEPGIGGPNGAPPDCSFIIQLYKEKHRRFFGNKIIPEQAYIFGGYNGTHKNIFVIIYHKDLVPEITVLLEKFKQTYPNMIEIAPKFINITFPV